MSNIEKTRKLLGRAESELAELAATASGDRDYDTAGRILAIAQAIKRLEDQFAPIGVEDHTQINGLSTTTALSIRHEGFAGRAGADRKAGRLGEYPRFLRNGDRLVKVGWSKTQKSEYEHNCPYAVVSSLVSSCLSVGGKGKRFAMDEVLPLKDPSDGSEYPSYQAYVSLAWLKSIGLIERHGRQGYSIRKAVNLPAKVDEAWKCLP